MASLLPAVPDRARYRELFRDDKVWEPAIRHLIEKHGLRGPVQRGTLGSHIVYRVGDVWLKLMAPLFAVDMPFEMSGLRAVEGRLSVATPKILAQGQLEGWPYVALSHLKGEPIRSAWAKCTADQKFALAEQIGGIIGELRRCPADQVIESRFEWNTFIRGQLENCEDQQKAKGLPTPWLSHIKEFLGRFDLSEFETDRSVFLHADLTFDHFLIDNGVVSGVIDLADCQTGHFEYELVAPAVFVFKGERELLSRFLHCSGVAKLDQRFSKKLLAWSIFHRYFSMISYFKAELDCCAPGDFAALAASVFPLDNSESISGSL